MARPLKFNHPLLLRLTADMWEKIKKEAIKKKIKPTELIRKIINEKFDK